MACSMTLKSPIVVHLNNICTGFWTRVIPPFFKRSATGKLSTTRSKCNYRRSSKKPKNDSKTSEAAHNNAKPFRYPPPDPVGKKHAAIDKGDENCFCRKAAAGA